jgi:large subunit ribosomal protein L23
MSEEDQNDKKVEKKSAKRRQTKRSVNAKAPKGEKTKAERGGRRRRASEGRSNVEEKLRASEIIVAPLATEKTIGTIERFNTLSFFVREDANKQQIKRAVETIYAVKVTKVRTLNSTDNRKKAFVRLSPESKAQDIATRLGIL